MLNYVWMFLMIVGIAVSVVSGRTEEIMDTIIESANNAVTFSIGLIGVVALWCGVIKYWKMPVL